MSFELNSFTIDVIFVIFCFFFTILGYSKGFISRFYDLIGTILCLFLAFYTHKYFSSLFVFVPVNEFTESIIFLPILNNIVSFIIVFIITYIIKKILGLFIKPLLNGVVNFIDITSFINHLLGMILSFFESMVISYIVLLLIMTPIVNNGYYYVNNTIIAKEVLKIVPSYSSTIMEWSQDSFSILEEKAHIDDEFIIDFIIKSYEIGMINDEQIHNLINDVQIDVKMRNEIKDKVRDLYEK